MKAFARAFGVGLLAVGMLGPVVAGSAQASTPTGKTKSVASEQRTTVKQKRLTFCVKKKGKKATAISAAKCGAKSKRIKVSKSTLQRAARTSASHVLCYDSKGVVKYVKGNAKTCKKKKLKHISLASLGISTSPGPQGAQGPQGQQGSQGPAGIGGTTSPLMMRATAYGSAETQATSVQFSILNYDPAQTYTMSLNGGSYSPVNSGWTLGDCSDPAYGSWYQEAGPFAGCGDVTGLTTETVYSVRVVATSGGVGSSPALLRIRTNGYPPNAPTISGVQSSPGGFNAGSIRTGFQLSFTQPVGTGTIDNYRVQYSPYGYDTNCYDIDGVRFGPGNLSSPCYVKIYDSYVPAAGEDITFTIMAHNEFGWSEYSAPFTFTMPNP